MIVTANKEDVASFARSHREKAASIGFVPTMGALHEGHLSLVSESEKNNDVTIASIFVNPTQFGPNEDLDKYPRTLEQDLRMLEARGVDLVFTPTDEDMYPEGYSVFIEEQMFSKVMEGAFRPGHFRGVCTIVFKLLAITQAHRLYLGKKDAQQLRILMKMAQDLHLGTEVIGCETLREVDGLAMSSRNRYLSPTDRTVAPEFYRALSHAKRSFDAGERSAKNLVDIARVSLGKVVDFKVQYVELRDWKTWEEVEVVRNTCILAAALHLGSTRLIDNIFLTADDT